MPLSALPPHRRRTLPRLRLREVRRSRSARRPCRQLHVWTPTHAASQALAACVHDVQVPRVPGRSSAAAVRVTTREIIRPGLPPSLVRAVEQYRLARIAPATARAYTSALRSFGLWCKANRLRPWPTSAREHNADVEPFATIVRGYLADLARRGKSMATINMARVAISEALRLAKLAPIKDSVRDVVKGIRRTHGVAPQRKKAPLLARDLAESLRTLPRTSAGTQGRSTAYGGARERAFLLVGWSCGMRRSEVAAIEMRDIVADDHAWILRIARSKTDQTGEGATLRIACIEPHEVCAACALSEWLDLRPGAVIRCGHCKGAGCDRCPVFGVCGRSIARAVKRAAARIGRSASSFSGHSLRRGYVTSARHAGVPDAEVMHVTRHRSVAVYRGYIEHADATQDVSTPAQRAFEAARRKSDPLPPRPDPPEKEGEDNY